MAFMFEKLDVYQKAVDLADETTVLSETFGGGYDYLAEQLNRAVLSIPSCIAQGNGRSSKPDRRDFFNGARGAVQECVPLFEIAKRRGLIDDEKHAALSEQLETLARMVSGLIKGLDRDRRDRDEEPQH